MKTVFGAAFVALGLQLLRPDKNLGPTEPGPDALVVRHQAPPEVRRLLEVACNDCHSDHTRYPWYAELQPVGWLLATHVREGRRALNLSAFGQLSASTQAKRLQYMIDVIVENEMPPATYVWRHRQARLSEEQMRLFAVWAAEVQARLPR